MAERIKILYLIGGLKVGGAERQLIELVRNMDMDKYKPLICSRCGGELAAEAERAGVKVKVLSKEERSIKNPFEFLSIIMGLYGLLRKERFDILQVYSYDTSFCFIGVIAAKFAGIPMIIVGRRSLEKFKSKLHLLMDSVVYKLAGVVIANSEEVKGDLLKKQKIDPSRVRVIYNGIQAGKYEVRIDKCRKRMEFGISSNCQVVGIIANFFRYKGHEKFLRAVKIVLEKFPDVKFLMVGKDYGMEKSLRILTAELNIGRSVIFAGLRRDVPEILQVLDIQVLSSYEEGFSNVILEGMASGKPLVVTDVGGNSEAVLNGETGIVVSPGSPEELAEAMIKFLENPGLAERMGKAGQSRVKDFSVEKMVKRTQGLYDEFARIKDTFCSG